MSKSLNMMYYKSLAVVSSANYDGVPGCENLASHYADQTSSENFKQHENSKTVPDGERKD